MSSKTGTEQESKFLRYFPSLIKTRLRAITAQITKEAKPDDNV